VSNVTSPAVVAVYGHSWWGVRGSVTAMAVLGLASGLPQPVHAETFNCGAGDVPCLIAVINEANANGQENTIRLEAGTYTLTDVDNDTNGPNGLPSITSHLTIKGTGADTTSVARDASAPTFRLVHVGTSGQLTVDGLTLTGGGGRQQVEGAGLFNAGGVVNIIRSMVSGNDGRLSAAGGLSNYGGVVNITRSTFADNSAGVGGGLTTGWGGAGGTVRITHSRFTGNGAFPIGVGGLLVASGTVSITNTTFDHNVGDGAGAIWVGGLSGGTTDAALVVADSAFTANGAQSFGSSGGIRVDFLNDTAVVTNSTFARNAAGLGDAIVNDGRLILINSTLADNIRGIGVIATPAVFSGLNATTVLLNTLLRNTLNQNHDCAGPVTSYGNNLIGDPTGCTIILRPTDLTGDPGLGTFMDNGKPGNGHFPLLPASQAIDAGNSYACSPTDQLGHRRIGPCDIGAIAFHDRDDRRREGADDASPGDDPFTTNAAPHD
jgi:hypothetical protein